MLMQGIFTELTAIADKENRGDIMKILMIELETLCYYNRREYPRPLRFKILPNPNVPETIERPVILKVSQIFSSRVIEKGKKKTIVYECISELSSKKIQYDLKYFPDTQSWYLYRY